MPLRLLLLVSCLGALAVPPVHAASATLDRIRAAGTITLAYREGASPFSFADRDGHVRGYSVELCTAVAASIQQALKLPSLKIVWQPVDAANRLDAVAGGRADAECGTTTITLARMEQVDFSVPIFVDGGSVLLRAKSKVATLADLRGKKVAVIPGTTTEAALVAALNVQGAPVTLVPATDAAQGASMVRAGLKAISKRFNTAWTLKTYATPARLATRGGRSSSFRPTFPTSPTVLSSAATIPISTSP
jgi:ABC-type amino acid transport substrate-binding protein